MNGKVILYADRNTDSIQHAVAETRRRRTLQAEFNAAHGITPRTVVRSILDVQPADPIPKKGKAGPGLAAVDLKKIDDLDFELAASLRDKARELEQLELQLR